MNNDSLPLFSGTPDAVPENPVTPPESAVPPIVSAALPMPRQQDMLAGSAAAARAKISTDGIPLTSYGPFLRELRRRGNLSISEIADATRIRSVYIEAVENEDMGDLPPTVYVLAYIKKICDFYQLPPDMVNTLTAEIQKSLAYEAPEDPTKTIVDVEQSQENPIIFRRLLIFGGLALFLLAGIVTGITLLLFPSGNRGVPGVPSAPGQVFRINENKLIELQKSPRLEISPLEYKAN